MRAGGVGLDDPRSGLRPRSGAEDSSGRFPPDANDEFRGHGVNLRPDWRGHHWQLAAGVEPRIRRSVPRTHAYDLFRLRRRQFGNPAEFGEPGAFTSKPYIYREHQSLFEPFE